MLPSANKQGSFWTLGKFKLSFTGCPIITNTLRGIHYTFNPTIDYFFKSLFKYSEISKTFIHIPNFALSLLDSLGYVCVVRDLQQVARVSLDCSKFFQENGGFLFYMDQEQGPNICNFTILDLFRQKTKNYLNASINVMKQVQNELNCALPFLTAFAIPLGPTSTSSQGSHVNNPQNLNPITTAPSSNVKANSTNQTPSNLSEVSVSSLDSNLQNDNNPISALNIQPNVPGHPSPIANCSETSQENHSLFPQASNALISNTIPPISPTQSTPSNIPTISNVCPLRSFVYIASAAPLILLHALKMKSFLGHQFIHFQIDTSFKVTRPFVYAVPRLELFWCTIPLGLVVAPTERADVYKLFFDCLQASLKKYNVGKEKENQVDIDLVKDAFFLSDKGSANLSFFKDGNINYGICTRHEMGTLGANSPLNEIASRILSTTTIDSWKCNRESYYNELKKLYGQMVSIRPTDAQKIKQFAAEMGLSDDISQSTEVKPFDETKAEELRELPIARDFSSITTNGPEGAHAKYNRICMKYTLEHRITKLLIKIVNEINTKTWFGPYVNRLKQFKDEFPNSFNPSCNCTTATYMKSVFGVPICPHSAAFYSQYPPPSYMQNIKWGSCFPWNNNNVFYLGKGNEWAIPKNMLTLYVWHKKISEHVYKCDPEEYLFMKCLRGLLYHSVKNYSLKNIDFTLDDIMYQVAAVLSHYFYLKQYKNFKHEDVECMAPIESDFEKNFYVKYAQMKVAVESIQTFRKENIEEIYRRVEFACNDSIIFAYKGLPPSYFRPPDKKEQQKRRPLLATSIFQ